MGKDKKEKSKSVQDQSNEESWFNQKMGRKHFLKKSQKITNLVIGGGLVGSFIPVACSSTNTSTSTNTPNPQIPPKNLPNPFQLGVASGDPLADGVVLWTRLAPKPLSADGGMNSEPVDVQWEVAEDQSFNKIVQQ